MRLNEGKRGPFRAWARLVPYPAFPFACALAIVSLSAPLAAQGANSGQAWWMAPQGPAYQILVYSFADSDGDGSGDLRGIIEKLDYLNDGNAGTDDDLGVQAIWLSPIHPAASYHGYDVLD